MNKSLQTSNAMNLKEPSVCVSSKAEGSLYMLFTRGGGGENILMYFLVRTTVSY